MTEERSSQHTKAIITVQVGDWKAAQEVSYTDEAWVKTPLDVQHALHGMVDECIDAAMQLWLEGLAEATAESNFADRRIN